MRILIFSWRCMKHPDAGGSELYFHELAKRWIKNGHKVTWFAPKFPGSRIEEIVDGIRIIRSGGKFSVYLSAFFNYVSGKLGKNYNVIIDVENGVPFFTPLYVGTKNIFLHVHHLHKDVWAREFDFPTSWIGRFLEIRLMPLVYKNKRCVTLSESSAKELLEENIVRRKPSIVNPGIEFVKTKKFAKSEIPAVLLLNRIKKYKGIDVFLRAVEILNERQKKIGF